MKFENVMEMLEKLGFEYVEDSDSGNKIVFSNGEKYVVFDESDENIWEVKEMCFKKIMEDYKFENKGMYFSREEEEDIYEVIEVGDKYVVRRESSCRFDVEVSVDICSSLKELVLVLRNILDYYDCYYEED